MVEIVTAPDRLVRSKGGTVTGLLYLRLPGVCFPSDDWDDFTVIVLGWWVQALARLTSGETSTEELDFMDGPCLVALYPLADQQLRFECRSERGRHPTIVEGTVALAELSDQVHRAASAIATACRSNGWLDRDLHTLEHVLELSPPA